MKKKPIQSFDIHSPRKMDRRSFLTRTGSAGLGATGLASTITQLQMVGEASAATTTMDMSKYKSLVCFFLGGGCDMNNVLIPYGNHPDRMNYEDDRQFAAVSETAIDNAGTVLNVTEVNGTAPGGGGNVFGLHPECLNMASHFNAGRLAFIANCGTLAVPIPEDVSLTDYQNAIKPIQLFSHSDQVNEWFSSIPQNPFVSGWAGRVADLFRAAPYINAPDEINKDSLSSMLMTAAGSTDLLVAPGGAVPQYALSRTGPINFAGYGSDYVNGLNGNVYSTGATGDRLRAFEGIMNYQHDHILEQGFQNVVKSARENEEIIGAAQVEADNIPTGGSTPNETGSYLNDIFLDVYNTRTNSSISNPTDLPNDMEELLIICKLIAGRQCIGNTRQIFFFNLGGFDTHNDINANLPPLLEQVDMCIEAFVQSMDAIAGAQASFDTNMVTMFEASDFNRTWIPNTSGTDHAWGTHTFCVGGAVEEAFAAGGSNLKVHGKFPELAVAGINDVPGNNIRGRWIPQFSTDQYYARLAKWFGVSSSDMNTIFPNLANGFSDPLTHPDLDFLPL